MLDSSTIQPLFRPTLPVLFSWITYSARYQLKDKIGAAFGSYEGSGEALKLVLEILRNKFKMHTIEPLQ
jgi:flavorubredoxin